jgi:hypothetical protein
MATAPTSSSFWDDLVKTLGDPNTQQLLANMGAAADPEGAGGIIGNAASRLISSKAAQSAAAKQLAGAESERQELRDQHRELINRLGPITAPDKVGLNGIKPAKDGTVDIDVNPADHGKLVSDLGGFTGIDEPGINSISRSPRGSTLVNYTMPKTVARQVDELAAAPTASRDANRLSYVQASPEATANEITDLLEPYAPRRSVQRSV